MRKYFWSELKRNRNALIVLVTLCAVLACVVAFNMSTTWTRPAYDSAGNPIKGQYVSTPTGDGGLGFFAGMLIVLCFFVPAYIYSFKMEKRSVDAHYSLPLRREGLYFVKTVIGLILVFVPYAVAFFAGISVVAMREHFYRFGYYFPYFFISLPLGFLLYGFYAFIFTRANTVLDGVVFMIAWSFAVELVMVVLAAPFYRNDLDIIGEIIRPQSFAFSSYMPFGFLAQMTDGFARLLCGNTPMDKTLHAFLFTFVTGGGGGALLFLRLPKEKAENAEQPSSSWWGYRVLIPVYHFCVSVILDMFLIRCILFAVAFVGYVIYRRSFKLKTVDWCSLLAACVLSWIYAGIFG